MARPVEHHLRIAMGDMVLQIAKMQATIEAQQDEISALKAELEQHKKDAPDGS